MKKILVADDSSTMRNFLRRTLTKSGYEVVGEADDGFKAIELYEKLRPDLLIVDVIMPELSGLEVVRQIIELNADAKIIVCTSMGQHYHREEAVKSGISGYIVKPFVPEEIIEAVEKII